jgi:putative DNA primase/helicase
VTGAADFLATVWGADQEGNLDGVHYIVTPYISGKGFEHFPVKTITEALDKADKLSKARRNAYFACAEFIQESYTDEKGDTHTRTGDNARGTRAFWFDEDVGKIKVEKGEGYATKQAALAALHTFCKDVGVPVPSIVDSGNGLHCYWTFSEHIARDRWRDIARKLKALAAAHGLIADKHRTADIASVLRVPGTMNFKDPANPKPVKLIREAKAIDLDAFVSALDRNSAHVSPMFPSNILQAAAPDKRPPETPDDIARVKSMLAVLPADCDRELWMRIVWGVQATGWQCAEDLAREWSATSDKFNEGEFLKLATSFKPDGGTGFGTLVHIAQQHGWVEPEGIESERFTGSGGDVKNGQLFARMQRNKLMYIHEIGDWLSFKNAAGWIAAPPGEEDRAAKTALAKMREVAARLYKESPEDTKTKRLMAHVERTSKAQNIRAMIEMAKSEDGMTVRLSDFDNDGMLLGVQNGVLNLRTGQLLPVSPGVLVSKRCGVSYDTAATCPRFQRFLEDVQPDAEMRAFLQRWAGYCLTGSVREQKLLFLFGGGANGKSVFIELLAWLLGDYSKKIATELLMQHQRSPQGPSPDIVALKGARLIYANETEEGRRLAESRVKDLTGGDTLTGRVPYGKADITFRPSHKLVIVGNHRPEITDNSHGMWRRVALAPFDVTIAEGRRDPELLEHLRGEGAGILNWALEGLRQWQSNGLGVPRKIEAATAAYRDEQDIIGEWVADHCETGAGRTAKKDLAYRAYREWARANGHAPMAQKRLTRRLGERGFPQLSDKRTIGGMALSKEGMACAVRFA